MNSYLSFARELARIAETEILKRFRDVAVEKKVDGTEVTLADRNAELLMRQHIEKQYPDHGILGEEFGEKLSNQQSPFQWVLDPIDGTASFTLGLPNFGTLIALCQDAEPVLGVIHLPAIQETLFAAKGFGTWFEVKGKEPVRVSVQQVARLREATVSATGLHQSDVLSPADEKAYPLTKLIHGSQKFGFWGDCLQHALVARGKVHVAVDPVMKPWDIAALVPCVEEAGGRVSSLAGERVGIVQSGSLLSSCGGQIHDEVLTLLST